MLVMPGLVNAHQHAEGVSTFQMGFVDEPFEPWMALMHALPSVDAYLTTLYKSMLMLTSGVTTHVHSHFPAKQGYGDDPAGGYLAELEGAVSAHRESGLRTALAPYWRDRASFVYDDDARFIDSLPDDLSGPARALVDGPRIPEQRLHRCHHRAARAARGRRDDRRPAVDRGTAVGVRRADRCRRRGGRGASHRRASARAREPPPAGLGR